ncbi:glycosyltransferase, exosortase A system-associated [Candidatus Binatia bacterium]|nr:glycosyltransferase, exosortase A system-associated [Candidatus Binatia bacterium]
MTRVLHVLDHSLPVLSGYSSRSHHILRAQRELGLDPVAVTTPKHGPGPAEETIDGITYYRTPVGTAATRHSLPGMAELGLMRRLAARVAEVARRHRAEVLHAHSPVLTAWPALWVGRRMRLPVVYEVRAFWEDAGVDHGTHTEGSLRYRTIRAVETAAMRRADAVGAICTGLRDEIRGRGLPAERLYLIPNGVDTDLFHPLPKDPDLLQRWDLAGKTVVGFIGSFYRYEGLDDLLTAWAAVARDIPAGRLLLIGGGEVADALRAQAEALGVHQRTVFAGPIPHHEVPRCYSVYDVLAYPRKAMRLTELVTPLKPLEAMASGRTVIASDVGGMRELIRDGVTGLLVPPDDPHALATALRRVMQDPALRERMGADARERICRERQWKTIVLVHVDTYARLLHR